MDTDFAKPLKSIHQEILPTLAGAVSLIIHCQSQTQAQVTVAEWVTLLHGEHEQVNADGKRTFYGTQLATEEY